MALVGILPSPCVGAAHRLEDVGSHVAAARDQGRVLAWLHPGECGGCCPGDLDRNEAAIEAGVAAVDGGDGMCVHGQRRNAEGGRGVGTERYRR